MLEQLFFHCYVPLLAIIICCAIPLGLWTVMDWFFTDPDDYWWKQGGKFK